MTIDDLAGALRAIATENWQGCHKPILLSGLPAELGKRLGGDYRPILGPRTLKSFIKDSGIANGYRLVEHPTQRAKIGVVPADVDFEFSYDLDVSFSAEKITKQDVEGFLRVLRSLSPDELARVSLPANLILKLLSTK